MPNPPEAVVNGKKVTKNTKSYKYSKHVIVALLFAVIGITGFLFASAATTTSSLWSNSTVPKNITDPDTQSVELGVKFQSTKAGKVTGVKFYKGAQNTGTHTGSLWDSSGHQLATVTFTNETASGWQTANFPQPVNIASGVTYVISYHAPKGHYSGDNSYFNTAYTNGILSAPASQGSVANGVYRYGSSSVFPSSTYKASNYWVDVIVQTDLIGSTSAPAPPTVVRATQSGSTVVVNWNAGTSSAPIAKYRIYKNNSYLKAVGNVLSFIDTNVSAGQTYTYQVKTVDINGVASARSVAASVTFNLTPPPTCPAGQTGTPPNCVITNSSGGVSACDPSKGYAGETCWYNNTGVLNTTTSDPNDRWTEDQIIAGQASAQLAHVGSPSAPVVVNLNTPGTVYENKWVDGCIKITANNVTVRNVLLRIGQSDVGNYQKWQCSWDNSASKGPAGLNNGGAQSGSVIQDTEIDGGFSSQCAKPPYGSCPVTYNFDQLMMNATGNLTLQRVNSHGGYAFFGYIGGSKIEDSYLHDVGHVHKFPQGDSRNGTPDDYHHDILWAQGMSNWSITHSFGTQWHDSDPWKGSSGGCLCNNTSSNWAFNNVFFDGQDNVDIAASNTQTKVVVQNVYGAHTSLGSIVQQGPLSASDYRSGAWTVSYSTASPAIPVIDGSRCSGVYTVTAAGVATKVGC